MRWLREASFGKGRAVCTSQPNRHARIGDGGRMRTGGTRKQRFHAQIAFGMIIFGENYRHAKLLSFSIEFEPLSFRQPIERYVSLPLPSHNSCGEPGRTCDLNPPSPTSSS